MCGITQNFFRKLITAWWGAGRVPSCDFWRLNNISPTKGAWATSANIVSVDEVSLRNDVNLARDPRHPSLRTKRIQGTGEFEASVNMDIRMAIVFQGDKLIIMLDIDHHDKLLRRRSGR